MKIAFVARTKGLEYDDRIRKECISLSKKHDVFIFVNFEDNRQEEGLTSYGTPFKSFKLSSRERLPSAKYLLIKSLEFYFRVYPYLKQYDLVWSHEEYTFMFPLFAKPNGCIWDLHEIPFRFERKGMKQVFNYIEKKSRKILHANNHRIKYLTEQSVIKHPKKHDYLRNLPDKQFLESTMKDRNYKDFIVWLDGSDYVYLQGLSMPRRHPYNTVEAILNRANLKAIVVGNFDKPTLLRLKEKYGNMLNNRVYFAGLVNQLHIPAYLRKAKFSIILYDIKTPNNRYCEPNRLYQAIIMNVPVVVGKNEPMTEIVESGEYGIAMETDGDDLEEIDKSISILLDNYQYYHQNTKEGVKRLVWSDSSIKESWYFQ
ncbi:glycosyltransferase [Flagellimonas allohymeniacidonis]|uniref:Glycosyltransferase family 1 protein n=1 Tax=Flagellimonas allohymeniacidonis TaxID=2517819 RepID=A0A4V2HSF0_9FLAO|nr:glycosyltransferase [Allomuricauda hymeniacidonis]TAI47540.1 glycosyltransferase family 1 protein [Allomuricauda hymeniacidonis]